MERPEEKRFLQHAAHFTAIDDYLSEFCAVNHFELDKNLHRTPCRVLRKLGNPRLLMDFYQEGNWFELDYSDSLPHTFVVGGYYTPSTDAKFAFKLERVLVSHQPFNAVSRNLPSLLSAGLAIIQAWTPETFLGEGVQVKNLRKSVG